MKMERIRQLHEYFEQVNSNFDNVSYEDTVLDDEILKDSPISNTDSSNKTNGFISSNGLTNGNGNSHSQNGLQEDKGEEDDDDDDEDDEDFDLNKDKHENGNDSDSEPDSVDYENDSGGDDDDEDDNDDEQEDNKDLNGEVEENVDNNHRNHKRSREKVKGKQPKSNLVQIDESKAEQVWDEFQKEVADLEAKKQQEAQVKLSEEVKTLVRRYEFAGETFTVQESYSFREKELLKSFEKIERAQKKNYKHPDRLEPPKRKIDLPDVLTQLKKSKLSTLSKTKHDWDEYKKDKDIVEELQQHTKSKHSYVERQAFLERADLRQYEKEKKVREHQRKIRMQKQYENVEIA